MIANIFYRSYANHLLPNNIIASIGEIDRHGFCSEEVKLMRETGKILQDKNIQVSATAGRVPVGHCHGESVYIKFKNSVSLKRILKTLECDYIEVLHDGVCLPTCVKGSNKTFVCRIRKVSKNEIMMFVIADNLRRGAAYNATEILKNLLKKQQSKDDCFAVKIKQQKLF